MFLTIWVHGTAGDKESPCGEVAIIDVTGEKIHCSVLEILLSDELPSVKMDWFGDLPTERPLVVDVKDISDEDGVNLEVVGYFEEPFPTE